MSFRPIGLTQQTPSIYNTTAKAVQSNTNDGEGYRKSAYSPGLASSSKYTFCGFFRVHPGQDVVVFNEGSGTQWSDYRQIFISNLPVNGGTMRIGIQQWDDANAVGSNLFSLSVSDESASQEYYCTSDDQTVHGIVSGDWFSVYVSIDASAVASLVDAHFWIRKVGDTAFNAMKNEILNANGPHLLSWVTQVDMAIDVSQYYDVDFDESEIFFDFDDTALDWSIAANRNLYVEATTGKPRGLGSNGYKLLGTSPRYYFPDGDLTNNKGTEGNFTELGTISNATTSPSD
jgi:hypothetical protein